MAGVHHRFVTGPRTDNLAHTCRLAVVLAVLIVSCTGARTNWGPLLVDDWQPSEIELIELEGLVRITEACVYLEPQVPYLDPSGEPTVEPLLIAWPRSRTSWDAGTGEIRSDGFDGNRHVIKDGTYVLLRDGYYWGISQVEAVSGTPIDDDCPVTSPPIAHSAVEGTRNSS